MPINYSDYPPDWAERRERILLRAWYCCEHCGLPDGAMIVRTPGRSAYRLPFAHELSEMKHYMYDRGFPKPNACRRAGINLIVLTIAHLDHDAKNWNVADDRLAALCQRCRLTYDMAQHQENRKYGRKHREKQMNLEFEDKKCKRCNCEIRNDVGDGLCAECWSAN